jgi:hypothetical protein
MTVANVSLGDGGTPAQWNGVGAYINNLIAGGGAIIENQTTPAGTDVNELRWSTTHQCMMKWSGTQWIAQDFPYFAGECTDLNCGFAAPTDPAGQSWATGLVVAANYRAIKATAGALSARIQPGTPVAGHQGVLLLGSGATAQANGGAGLMLGSTAQGGQAGLRFRCEFMLPSIVSTITQRIGFIDTVTSADCTDGAYLEIVNGVATFKTSAASTRTSAGSPPTLTATTWYTLHVIFTDVSHARCILVTDAGVATIDVTNAANVPSISQLFGAGAIATNSAATNSIDHLALDWIGTGVAA